MPQKLTFQGSLFQEVARSFFLSYFKQLGIILVCPLPHQVTRLRVDIFLGIFQTSPFLFVSCFHHCRPGYYQLLPGTTGVSYLVLFHVLLFPIISHITTRGWFGFFPNSQLCDHIISLLYHSVPFYCS